MRRRLAEYSAVTAGIVAIGLITALLLYVHRLTTGGDNLDYLHIAWRTLHDDILQPFRTRYPVGYPYILSALFHVTGLHPAGDLFSVSQSAITAAKLLNVLALLPTLYICHEWLKKIDSPFPVATSLILASSQVFVTIFSVIGSEPLFILFSMMSIWSWERMAAQSEPSPHLVILTFCSTFLAAQMRQIGMAIPVAVIVYTFLSGRYRNASWISCAAFGAVLPLLLSLLIMVLSEPSNLSRLFSTTPMGDHADATSFNTLSRVVVNLKTYRFTIPDLLVPKILGENGILSRLHIEAAAIPMAVFIYALVLLGVISQIRQRRSCGAISLCHVLISLAIIVVWPFQSGRFFVPLIPFLIWLAVLGLSDSCARWMPHGTTCVAVLLSAILAWQIATDVFAANKNLRNIWRWKDYPAWYHERYVPTSELDFADLLECGEWLSRNSPPTSVVVSSKALFVQVSSHRMTYYPAEIDNVISETDDGGNPVFIVVDAFPGTTAYGRQKNLYIRPLISSKTNQVSLVHSAPYAGTEVYEYHRTRQKR